jgi:hypothetical protein
MLSVKITHATPNLKTKIFQMTWGDAYISERLLVAIQGYGCQLKYNSFWALIDDLDWPQNENVRWWLIEGMSLKYGYAENGTGRAKGTQ